MKPLNELVRAFWSRPQYQRLFLAFTVGLGLACAARVSDPTPVEETISVVEDATLPVRH